MLPLQLTIINIVRSLLEFFFLSMENFVLFYVHFKNVLSKKLYISVLFFLSFLPLTHIIPIGTSRPVVFCKKCVLKNFAKVTGKHLYQSLFFNKVSGLRPATLFKKRLGHRCFPVRFTTFLRTPCFAEHLCWLLLPCAAFMYKSVHFYCK